MSEVLLGIERVHSRMDLLDQQLEARDSVLRAAIVAQADATKDQTKALVMIARWTVAVLVALRASPEALRLVLDFLHH